VAGIIAFSPVEQVSTPHNAIFASTTGIACASETVDMGDEIDNDTITFTFDQPILIHGITFNGAANMAGDTLGFDGTVTVDGAIETLSFGAFEENLADAPDLTWQNEGPWTVSPIYVGSTLDILADDNDATTIDANDDFTVTFCGLVENAGNFDGDDVAFAITEDVGGGGGGGGM